MELNYTLIILATVLQFALGALWYSPLVFGKWWMEVMEVTHLSKEEIQKKQKEMAPAYVAQFIVAFIMTWVLASNFVFLGLSTDSGIAAYTLAFFFWLGYMLPVQVGAVMWSQTKKKFWIKQIFVASSYQLLAILLATFILTF
jgi:hypothetical protein